MWLKNASVISWLLAAILVSGTLAQQIQMKISEATLARVQAQHGEQARQRVLEWRDLLQQHAGETTDNKLMIVNRFFNQRPFVSDPQHWQQADYWATPVEFLATDGGDCEDFTIAKYFSLLSLGVPSAQMRLLYVTAVQLNQAHMVLAFYPSEDAIPLILDNINPQILPADQRRDLLPIYSFNGEGLWLAKAQGRGRQVQQGGNYQLWESLMTRIEQGY